MTHVYGVSYKHELRDKLIVEFGKKGEKIIEDYFLIDDTFVTGLGLILNKFGVKLKKWEIHPDKTVARIELNKQLPTDIHNFFNVNTVIRIAAGYNP